MAMDNTAMNIETGRPRGLNPTTHFWFERATGERVRICDGASWAEEPEPNDGPTPYAPCNSCKELYLEDILYGRQMFEILPKPLAPTRDRQARKFGAYSPKIGAYAPAQEYTPQNSGCPMPTVPIASFARFYKARPPDKVRIVRDIRIQQSDPEGYAGRDYYNDLRNILRRTHWQTNDIEVFESALEQFLASQRNNLKKEHFRQIGEAYIRHWKRLNASLFDVLPVEVNVAGLTILVRPEVGMHTDDGDDYVLKLWLNSPRLTRQYRQANRYLMEQARTQAWPIDWQPALWDVRRENIPPPVSVARDFILGLEGQAAAFQQIWTKLDDLADSSRGRA